MQEQFIILLSYFQLTFFSNCINIFIEAIFKSTHHIFYQSLNIISHKNKENSKIADEVAYILTPHKSFITYKYTFKEPKNLIEDRSLWHRNRI